MKRLEGKTAVITGGGRGIGAATAGKFLEEGANVVVVDVNQDDLDHVVNEAGEQQERILGIKADITSKQDIDHVLAESVRTFTRVDILINNAGITADSQLLKMEEEDWDKVINVNLKGVFLMTQKAAALMKEQQSGVILNASSVVGVYGNFGQTNYAASKFGINGMTKTWAKELGRYKIRVNSVAPGFILSPMTEKMPEKALTMMKEKAVLGTLGRPEDIANAYAFLASDEASFITGAVLNVDGGAVI
ncbi:3-oxoacyl-[acyl-carrier-protein] reductase [Sinobaca qinghaiensis]|uniref:3-oxoacyl-[acyl-carrier-protein] reductase n=1 Tax=Sinobaca qinghaiensis TaxID=342944 RepID=A0A419UWH5_9BACL|nr:3-oxoacyl-ACP reductase FabG [Sinobaca qinghaiensis]RKD69481.1 3-oxoacyl-[acyl-carrier-protein] reductase [Sinobaca qinghaiensis]